MKRTYLYFIIIFIISCNSYPDIHLEREVYNIFLVMRNDKNIQKMALSKVYAMTDTVYADVKAEAMITHGTDTFKFKRIEHEYMEAELTPEPEEVYTLIIDGECGHLEVEKKTLAIPDMVSPEEGDTLILHREEYDEETINYSISDTFKIIHSLRIAGYEIRVFNFHIGFYYLPDSIQDGDTLDIIAEDSWIVYKEQDTVPHTLCTLKVIACDSAYYNRYFQSPPLIDTVNEYMGIISSLGIKEMILPVKVVEEEH